MIATRSVAVFDLGGVLIDWNPRHLYRKLFDGDEKAMEHFLATVCTPSWNAQQDAGRTFANACASLRLAHPRQAGFRRPRFPRGRGTSLKTRFAHRRPPQSSKVMRRVGLSITIEASDRSIRVSSPAQAWRSLLSLQPPRKPVRCFNDRWCRALAEVCRVAGNDGRGRGAGRLAIVKLALHQTFALVEAMDRFNALAPSDKSLRENWVTITRRSTKPIVFSRPPFRNRSW